MQPYLLCFDRAENLRHNMSVIFHFCTRMTRKIDKNLVLRMSENVLYSPPYFDAVMHKCCIGTSEVSRLMCSKRLMGDECFNNFEDKNI